MIPHGEAHDTASSGAIRCGTTPSTLGNRPIFVNRRSANHRDVGADLDATPETAKRVKQRIERVVQWVRDGMPLPNGRGRRRSPRGHAFAELPAFMASFVASNPFRPRALEFTVLTAARTSEVLKATWDEIDLKAKVWSIPAQRMKGNRPHRVPLSDRAVRISAACPRDGSDWLFPGSRLGRPLAADSLLKLLTRLRPGLTVHGLRSSFRDWAGDRTAYPRDVIEMAFAHAIKDKAKPPIEGGDALEKRRTPDGGVGAILSVGGTGGETDVVALHG